jgi:diaminohydroxyphosphoribosylaminopyrimidine deaminase/5-amino-6-(5-phosphoribosylamino)uracil reductase
MAFGADDHRYMAEALRLAEKGLFTTDPNPRVGCVMVRDAEVVGRGWHERAGLPHAEVLALREAGERARGATAYVSLEPCCHHGRTPPCTEALIGAGVARVVAALEDPNFQVRGKGMAQLRAAGMVAEHGLCAAPAERLNRGFCRRMRSGVPWVTLKLGASLDGRTAMADGESRWITGEAAREDVQRLRARVSAVATGFGTVLADDPRLDVRLPGVTRQPRRVIFDSRLRAHAGLRCIGPGTLVFTATEDPSRAEALAGTGVEIVHCAGENGRVDLARALLELGRRDINELLVEAGAGLSGALLEAGLADDIVLYLAPGLLGHNARALFELNGIHRLSDRIALKFEDVRLVGEDIRVTASPKY